jgi:hypothetical protein
MLKKLKNHPLIASAWIKNGQIWAIQLNSEQKFKIGINDEIEDKLQDIE